ncbi:MAG: DNA methylase [Clostridia bacterium]|nr:DNA methylase [Clostridia bacterium]
MKKSENVQPPDRVYIAIDLKSFYASVECIDRKLDPLSTHLVVADPARTEKTICLAVSPSLKALGIPGRPRLFEVVQRVREINLTRLRSAARAGLLEKDEKGAFRFSRSSPSAPALAADPSLELSYIVAPPRMRLYEEISTKIFSIYRKSISPEDIHVYSIDEVFMDVTSYLKSYGVTAHELAMRLIREVLDATGITATAGIGTNLYLAKVAMDIVAKHAPADAQGVRIAELNEQTYREILWCHRPLTDFWRVGRGLARRLESLRCFTMGDVARLSLTDEERLYKAFGINAELLIDHAWGWEPVGMEHIRTYRPENNSISTGQVLPEPYDSKKGRLIVREMTELLVLDLVRRQVVTKQITLTVNYDRESIAPAGSGYIVTRTGKPFNGNVTPDRYGRPHPGHAHGTGNLDHYTSSTRTISHAMMNLYDRIVDPDLLIRHVIIAACGVLPETDIPENVPLQLDLFTDYEALEKEKALQKAGEEKERRLQKATLALQARYGKNAVLKGMNFLEGGTTIERNGQIGGHRSGDAERPADRIKKQPNRIGPEGGHPDE